MKKLALLVISTIFISCTSNSSNEDSNDVLLPTLTTKAVSTITQYTAWSGGDILNDFNYPSISRGLVWSTNPNPTISLSTKTSDQFDNSGPGSFTSVISGLVPNTTYYMRSYATNSSGTSYGNEVSFTSSVAGTNQKYYFSTSGNDANNFDSNLIENYKLYILNNRNDFVNVENIILFFDKYFNKKINNFIDVI